MARTAIIAAVLVIAALIFLAGTHRSEAGRQRVAAGAKEKDSTMSKKIQKSEAEWRAELTPEQYRVTRECGTEPPFSGKYYYHHEDGTYRCVACGNVLFDSETKYESGSGWPSFYRPAAQDAVEEKRDTSHGMVRTEVVCSRCGAHLGHVFPDGPNPTGLRYCINSAALDFEKDTTGAKKSSDKPDKPKQE